MNLMNDFREKYINTFSNYGFKWFFGEEPKKVFYDKLTFIFLVMPRFNLSINKLGMSVDEIGCNGNAK